MHCAFIFFQVLCALIRYCLFILFPKNSSLVRPLQLQKTESAELTWPCAVISYCVVIR